MAASPSAVPDSSDVIEGHSELRVPGHLLVAAYGGGAAMSTARTMFAGSMGTLDVPAGLLESMADAGRKESARLGAMPIDRRIVPHRDLALLLKRDHDTSDSAVDMAKHSEETTVGGIDWTVHLVVSSLPYGVEEEDSPMMPIRTEPSSVGSSRWIRANLFHHGWALSKQAGWEIGKSGAERGAGVWLLGALGVVRGNVSIGGDDTSLVSLGNWIPAATHPKTGRPIDDPSWLCVQPGTTDDASAAAASLTDCDTAESSSKAAESSSKAAESSSKAAESSAKAAESSSKAAESSAKAPKSSAKAAESSSKAALLKRARPIDANPTNIVLTAIQPCDTHCHTVESEGDDAAANAQGIRTMMQADGASDEDIAAVLEAMGLISTPSQTQWHIGGDTGRISLPASDVGVVWVLAIQASTAGNTTTPHKPRGLATLLVTVPPHMETNMETRLQAVIAHSAHKTSTDSACAIAKDLLSHN